jgi:hypothetical protein
MINIVCLIPPRPNSAAARMHVASIVIRRYTAVRSASGGVSVTCDKTLPVDVTDIFASPSTQESLMLELRQLDVKQYADSVRDLSHATCRLEIQDITQAALARG